MTLTKAEIEVIVSDIGFNDWKFRVDESNGRVYVQIQFYDSCSITGEPQLQKCRKWFLSEWMVKQEVVRTCWKAVEAAVVHEAQEQFKYKGRAIYGPHIDPDALWKVARQVDYRGKNNEG